MAATIPNVDPKLMGFFFSNLDDDITNSDLELAGSIAQNNILAQVVDVTKKNNP